MPLLDAWKAAIFAAMSELKDGADALPFCGNGPGLRPISSVPATVDEGVIFAVEEDSVLRGLSVGIRGLFVSGEGSDAGWSTGPEPFVSAELDDGEASELFVSSIRVG